MNRNYMSQLCRRANWGEVRKYVASDASNEDKKKQICSTCLFWACRHRAPQDIVKSFLDIGGKELVMFTDSSKVTALHACCYNVNASFDVMKMLIDVGGKELVMAQDYNGDTALHNMIFNSSFVGCSYQPIDEIKFILEAADTKEILQAKNNAGKTALQIETAGTLSNEIKDLLGLPRPSTFVLNNDKTTTETNKRQRYQITPNKQYTTASRTIASSSPLEQTICNLQKELKGAQEHATKNQRDFDRVCADNINLEGALLQKGEHIENLHSEVRTLTQQNIKNEKYNRFYKRYADNLAIICSEQKIKLEEMEDAANAIESAGEKRKRGNEEHAFTSNADGDIEGFAMEEKIMGQYLFEREEHSKVLKQLFETRRELRIARAQLERSNDSTTCTGTGRTTARMN